VLSASLLQTSGSVRKAGIKLEGMGTVVERLEAGSATDDDLNGLNALLQELSSSAQPLRHEDLDLVLTNPNMTLLVARRDGLVVGTLTLTLQRTISGHRARIEDVVTSVNVRRQGVGRLLIRTAVETAKGLGLRSVDLTSRPPRQDAIQLYLSEGFQPRETNVYRLSL
jgi:ribosomal protein S18 acetylase RimI-like enzyme